MGKIIGIKYISPIFDGSGYAEAGRNYILALHKTGIPITISPISFEKTRPDLGEVGKTLGTLVEKDIPYNVLINHLTPEHNPKFYPLEPEGVYKVNYSVWETTAIPKEWVPWLNMSDLNLVACTWNKQVYEQCGVTRPIEVVPHGINVRDMLQPKTDCGLQIDLEGKYVFYTIGQYTARKNIDALIKLFWYAFDGIKDVALVVKTYGSNYTFEERQRLETYFSTMKRNSRPANPPSVHFIFDCLSRDEMIWLHQTCDCFVSLTRGEGFGIPILEAAACGNPIITTGIGGPTDFLEKERSILIRHTFEPVSDMPHIPWYNVNQLWAQPDIFEAAEMMTDVYTHQDWWAEKGIGQRVEIAKKYSWKAVAKQMIDQIEKQMDGKA